MTDEVSSASIVLDPALIGEFYGRFRLVHPQAEQRMVETIETGAPRTGFLKAGDRVQIRMKDSAGRSIFGEIDQTVAAWED